MRWPWILLSLAALSAVVVVVFLSFLPPPLPPPNEPEAAAPPAPANLPVYRYAAAGTPAIPHFEYQSFTDRLLLMIDPLWFGPYQGSYTLEELSSGAGTSSFSINSSWLMHDPSIPQVGVVLWKEPDQDTYRVSGGELFLPESGMGISYEKIEETGETRAFLKFKREF